MNKLGENLDVPVYFSLVPDKSWSVGLLPRYAPNQDDGSTISQAQKLCGENVTFIDMQSWLAPICGNADPRGMDYFYRTDHHWTTMGAYRGYSALMEGMGLQPADWSRLPLTQVSGSFYGTTYSSAGAGWVKPDSIYAMIPEGGTKGHVTVTGYPEGEPIESSLYHPEKLEVKDKYAYFLGGNQPLCVLQNPDAPNE